MFTKIIRQMLEKNDNRKQKDNFINEKDRKLLRFGREQFLKLQKNGLNIPVMTF